MIHPTAYGNDLRLRRRDGHYQIYRIARGCEVQAIQEIFVAYKFGRLSEHEAGLLLSGVAQLLARPSASLTLNPPRAQKDFAALRAGFDRPVRLFCEWLGLGDEACELGGRGK